MPSPSVLIGRGLEPRLQCNGSGSARQDLTLLHYDGKSPVPLEVKKSQSSPTLLAAAGISECSVPLHALHIALLLQEFLRTGSSLRTVPPLLCDASFVNLSEAGTWSQGCAEVTLLVLQLELWRPCQQYLRPHHTKGAGDSTASLCAGCPSGACSEHLSELGSRANICQTS